MASPFSALRPSLNHLSDWQQPESFASILAVFPSRLLPAPGRSRARFMGTTVIDGMTAASLLGIFTVPAIVYLVERWSEASQERFLSPATQPSAIAASRCVAKQKSDSALNAQPSSEQHSCSQVVRSDPTITSRLFRSQRSFTARKNRSSRKRNPHRSPICRGGRSPTIHTRRTSYGRH
jgi:hypothetical protein